MKRELSQEEMAQISGGDTASADEWLQGYMDYLGLKSKSEALESMDSFHKAVYKRIQDEPTEFIKHFDRLDQN